VQQNSPEAVLARKTIVEAYEQYRPELRRFFARQSRTEDADDLVQAMWERLLRYPPREVVQAPQEYLYRVAWMVLHRHRTRDRIDQTRVTYDQQAVEQLAQQAASAHQSDIVEQLCTEQQLERILGQLPPHWQAAIILLKRDGLSYQEIAKELGLSVHTVKKYIARALAHFKSRLTNADRER
jgi:RNA polymerase sigma factor (sigma-70 family)